MQIPVPEAFKTLGLHPFLFTTSPDERELSRRILSLSRKFHPDLFVNKSDEERKAAEDQASPIQWAAQKIKEFQPRLRYVLDSIKEQLPSETKQKQILPPDFASSYFELQELLMEEPAKAQALLVEFKLKIQEQLQNTQEALKEIAKNYPFRGKLFDESFPWEVDPSQIIQIRDLDGSLKYLERVSEDLKKFDR